MPTTLPEHFSSVHRPRYDAPQARLTGPFAALMLWALTMLAVTLPVGEARTAITACEGMVP